MYIIPIGFATLGSSQKEEEAESQDEPNQDREEEGKESTLLANETVRT